MKYKKYYYYNDKNCYAEKMQENGISVKDYDKYLKIAEKAFEKFINDIENKMPCLDVVFKDDDLEELDKLASNYRNKYDNVVVFGTGGSSLGAESLQQIANIGNKGRGYTKLHIITNVDPYTYLHRLKKLDFTKTGFIVISKSGKTIETIMQFLTILPELEKSIGVNKLKDHITFISEEGDNPLRKLSKKYDVNVLNHDKNLGGRYSVFSLVGVLPALIVGLSGKKLRDGAKDVLNDCLEKSNDINKIPAIRGAIIKVWQMVERKASNSILIAYADRLGSLARWYRQLWAESIGKNGLGTQPVYGLGPVDQHSQLQLWLDGPNDKIFTFLGAKKDIHVLNVCEKIANEIDFQHIGGKSLNDLLNAARLATAEALKNKGRINRTIELNTISDASMGAVLMHFIIETIISAYMLNINPFDQPAVEENKILIKKYLEKLDFKN